MPCASSRTSQKLVWHLKDLGDLEPKNRELLTQEDPPLLETWSLMEDQQEEQSLEEEPQEEPPLVDTQLL